MTDKKPELTLKEDPTLKDLQQYVHDLVEQRGFAGQPIAETFMKFFEEAGEMSRAAKHRLKMMRDKNSEVSELSHEVADVFIYLLDICNYFEIDLEQAFREKEEVNKKRTWSV